LASAANHEANKTSAKAKEAILRCELRRHPSVDQRVCLERETPQDAAFATAGNVSVLNQSDQQVKWTCNRPLLKQ
jgi:hypothetical protein